MKLTKKRIKRLLELYWAFVKIGGLTFGGGMSMMPMLTRECVENYKWATEEELMEYYAIGQCTPGVIAVNTATFVGYKEEKWLGALFATCGMVTPSLIIIMIIAAVLRPYMELAVVIHAFSGIRVAVGAMLIHTITKMINNNVKNKLGIIVFILTLLIALFTSIPVAVIIISDTVFGIIYSLFLGKKEGK